MRYNYNIKIKSEFPPQVITSKLEKISDTFTTIENIEEVEDEVPLTQSNNKEDSSIYV